MSRLEKKTYLITTLIWLVACAGYNTWEIHTYINSPIDDDLYAHHWDFCLIVFAIFKLPIWLIALVLVIGVEATVFANRRADRPEAKIPHQ